MPPKRKNESGAEDPTARERKKQKVAVARTIAVQPAMKVSFSENTNAVVDSSSKSDTLYRLPSAIDVERFAEARAFEIDAMQSAMKNARASSTQRAWQALPRHLRRRAASHDVRRVPLRLREKARAEMDPVRKKALGRSMPKRGKDKRISHTESFLKRQRDKTWLETHIWHAKRMKMENMWSYRLAVHPTEKAFRPSHRASVHGSILHDASYYSLIELKGPENILKRILEVCCDPQGQGPGAKRYLTGSRSLDTHIYKPGSYPFDFIAPITIMWKPLTSSPIDDSMPTDARVSQKPDGSPTRRKRKGTRKDMEINIATPAVQADPAVIRTIWLRSHPAVFDEIFPSLQAAISLTLDAAKRSRVGDHPEIDVEIADLRGQVNVFELMGPKSSQVIKGALSPIAQDKREDFTKFWSALADLQTCGSVPRGMIIGFKVYDPRLKFPPKNAKPKFSSSEHVRAPITTFPTSVLAQSEIWDESIRTGLAKPRYKKKDLDERRSKMLIPGTPLKSLRQDDRIPVLLVQRSLENQGSDSQAIHGWTLIIPAGWSMAFFSSLTFTGTRVGGQRERQTQAFEAGTVYFPRDYVSSKGYEAYARGKANEERGKWERKPPAKRPNFDKLGTRSPWSPDWEVVLGLRSASSNAQTELDKEFVPAQREEPAAEMDLDETNIRIWLLRGSEVPEIVSNVSKLFNQGAGLLQEMNRLRLKRSQEPLDSSIKADELVKGALISVRVKICKRGCPDDLAAIYSVEDDEARRWERALHKMAKFETLDESPDEIELSEIKPSQSSIIGYVTTGHFSLSQGEGFAIGAIPVARMFELQQQSHRLYPKATSGPPLLIKLRNGNSRQCRAAYLEVLEN